MPLGRPSLVSVPLLSLRGTGLWPAEHSAQDLVVVYLGFVDG